MVKSMVELSEGQLAVFVLVPLGDPGLHLADLGDDLTGVVVVGDVVPESLGFILVELTVLVGVVVVKNPLGVLLELGS